jgi:hypothetical protein
MFTRAITPQSLIEVIESYEARSIDDPKFVHTELTSSNPLLKGYVYFNLNLTVLVKVKK